MISLMKQRTLRTNNQSGFSLVEVMVAIFIGLIVMGMAVAILGVTNSVSLRVLAKSEAQQNTRNSIVKLLDSLANAESLETCRIGLKENHQTLIRNNPDGRSGVAPINCKEFTFTGQILAWAQPNKLCYYDKKVVERDDFPLIRCISRGGAAASTGASPNWVPNNAVTGINLTNCVNNQPVAGSSPNLVYVYTCTPQGSPLDRNRWATSFSTPQNSSVIADLGDPPAGVSAPEIFEYSLSSTAKVPLVTNDEIVNLVSVDVKMSTRYATKGPSQNDTYKFSQAIVLRQSKYALEEINNE